MSVWLRFTLESDATFGRGLAVPGLLDQEVTLDRYGCPYLHGRTLKGLLNEVCADILFALGQAGRAESWQIAADELFGRPGSGERAQGALRVGHARLPVDLRRMIRAEITKNDWTPTEITQTLTTIRQQTALKPNGAPDPHTLRSVRVILRETPFEAELTFRTELTDPRQKGLLAACVLGLRRAGTARNRGRGLLTARLEDEAGQNDLSRRWYAEHFKKEVCA